MTFYTFSEAQLRAFTEAVFLKMGCPPGDAELAADVLLKSDLRGIDSHGVARLSGYVIYPAIQHGNDDRLWCFPLQQFSICTAGAYPKNFICFGRLHLPVAALRHHAKR